MFPYKRIREQIWRCRKKGQGQPRVIIWINFVVLSTWYCLPSFKVIGYLVPEKIFKFLPYIVMWPDHLNKLSFPHPMEPPYEIWLPSAQWFQRRMFENVDVLTYLRTTKPAYTISSSLSLWLKLCTKRKPRLRCAVFDIDMKEQEVLSYR